MKKEIKQQIKQIIHHFPLLEKFIRLIRGHTKIKDSISIRKIKGKNNNIQIDKSAILLNCTFDIVGNDNQIEIQASCIINNLTFYIRGNKNKIKIGKKVEFLKGGSIWIEDFECEANIGDYTSFVNVHIAVTEPRSKICIGKDCMFAYDIEIRSGDSHSIINAQTLKRINYAQNIEIGNHVWVASHVSILKGVKISDNSVIATGAVVTKSFENENILIGGTPAKKIKENINWNRKREYQK